MKKKKNDMCRNLIFFIALFLFGSMRYYNICWKVSFDTALYQLLSPLKGTNPEYIYTFIKMVVVPVLLFYICWQVIWKLILNIVNHYTVGWKIEIKRSKLFICLNTRILIKIRKGLILLFDAFSFIYILISAHNIGFFTFISNYTHPTLFYEEYYVSPSDVQLIFPEQKKNLILIYLESMETTYMDVESGGGKPVNYIPELTELAKNNINFSNSSKLGGAYNATSTGWTIAAILGSSCGIPFKMPIEGNSADMYADFLPGVCGIGDILESNGYKNYFLCGSDASFAGRDVFFQEHGDYTIFDYNYAVEQGKENISDKTNWGYDDKKLFSYAREYLSSIGQLDEPFNFTMLTVDTHHPDGYICDLCDDQYNEQYANVIACSSKQTMDFIRWISEQPWYENTVVVVIGDHLSMNTDFWNDIGNYERCIYNCFINTDMVKDEINTNNREFSCMDFFPTILSAMSVQIEGDQLGLGVNLFSDKKTLYERLGRKMVDTQLAGYSKYYINEFVRKEK